MIRAKIDENPPLIRKNIRSIRVAIAAYAIFAGKNEDVATATVKTPIKNGWRRAPCGEVPDDPHPSPRSVCRKGATIALAGLRPFFAYPNQQYAKASFRAKIRPAHPLFSKKRYLQSGKPYLFLNVFY